MKSSKTPILLIFLILLCNPLWLHAQTAPAPSLAVIEQPAQAEAQAAAKACPGELSLPAIEGKQAVCSQSPAPGEVTFHLSPAPTNRSLCPCQCSNNQCCGDFCRSDDCRFLIFC